MTEFHHQPQTLATWLARLEQLHPKPIALGLDRVGEVKGRMGLQPAFPIITVAGTNGKGSTCTMLESILTEAGYKVGCYTSPHLLRYNERVRVAGREAADDDLCAAFAAVETVRGEVPLTYFEYGTLAAVWLFMREQVDVAVLEIGLGGRLDAVNVFDPDCALITSIDLDHIDYLGDSRESIGREKAGIFRTSIPAVCGDPNPPQSVVQVAQHINARYFQSGRDFDFVQRTDGWCFRSGAHEIDHLPFPALLGSFQRYNVATVLEALHLLSERLPVTREHIAAGLQHVQLHGRFEACSDGKHKVILDVAHNPQAARGLAENLRSEGGGGRTLAVFAMLSDKDIAGVVDIVGELIDIWFIAGISGTRGTSAGQLAEIVNQVLPQAEIVLNDDVPQAYAQACRSASENDRIVVFGSFYTVADVMRGSYAFRPISTQPNIRKT